MKFKDYYQALGIERTASTAQVKQAYRKLAHKFHPDVSKDPKGEEKFKEIAEAYATLKDPEKRQAYDDLGKRPAGEQFTPPSDWQHRFNADAANFDTLDLADLFAAFGRGRHGAHQRHDVPMPGQDYEVIAPVTLEQSFHGDEIDVHADLPELDPNGLNRRVPRTFRVTLPKGATHGQRLRLPGKGGPGYEGGRPGDLYVVLALQDHPLYRVSGRDLYLDLPLAPWEAVLGTTVQCPTLAGVVELTIAPGTTAGQKLRLAGRGLTAAHGGAGALYAVVSIQVPKTVSPEARKLFEQLAAASQFNPRPHFGHEVKS